MHANVLVLPVLKCSRNWKMCCYHCVDKMQISWSTGIAWKTHSIWGEYFLQIHRISFLLNLLQDWVQLF